VNIDLAKSFDTVNHDLLMHFVSRKVHDKRVLSLIGKYLRAGVVVNGRLEKTSMGVPPGWGSFTSLSQHPAGQSGQGA
jgi:RNA-directed DNA polymerase